MKTHGGKRKGAGRNPLPESEKKSELRIFVQNKRIDEYGGADKLKEKILQAIEASAL